MTYLPSLYSAVDRAVNFDHVDCTTGCLACLAMSALFVIGLNVVSSKPR